MNKRFEYCEIIKAYVELPNKDASLNYLNEMGAQGWELIQVTNGYGRYVFLFKRELGDRIPMGTTNTAGI